MEGRNLNTTDHTGFDYMANTGIEETDRDIVGMVAAIIIMIILTACQYLKLY